MRCIAEDSNAGNNFRGKDMANQSFKNISAGIALAGYLFLAVFGLVSLSSHHMHLGASAPDCPYAVGLHSICTMGAIGHIETWEQSLLAIVPSYLAILSYMVASIVLLIAAPNGPRIIWRRPDRQHSPYVALFAQGILNPKIP